MIRDEITGNASNGRISDSDAEAHYVNEAGTNAHEKEVNDGVYKRRKVD